ncbi:matrixin family metalloprotease [Mycetocola saprophilus]|uniref:matrixin family metalloprotease n=1 Tax=Mycetocola saprophilus TaxID=76636 RepID=UPI003BF41FEC
MRHRSLVTSLLTVGLVVGGGITAISPAQAYGSLGCRWVNPAVQLNAPAPLLSAPAWGTAASTWSWLNASVTVSSSGSPDVYGTNELRGNTVTWSGVTRGKGTAASFPPCNGGNWVNGQMEVVLNWSYVGSYSAAQRQGVAAHELGHALGLAHNPSSRAILMYPDDSRTTSVPANDDRAGINAIY